MPTSLILQLAEPREPLHYNMSSVLQGILMEKIDPLYASYLHQSSLHPYSQYVCRTAEGVSWVINTLDKDADEHIIRPLLEPSFDTVTMREKGICYPIVGKTVTDASYDELFLESYGCEKTDKRVKVTLVTPTAFKSNGQYQILLNLRLFWNSLLNRYQSFAENTSLEQEDLLENILDSCFVAGYNLKSTIFSVEGIHIPSFMGTFTLQLTGNDALNRLMRMLLSFGEFSGVGIKTGIGMGALQIAAAKRKNQREDV